MAAGTRLGARRSNRGRGTAAGRKRRGGTGAARGTGTADGLGTSAGLGAPPAFQSRSGAERLVPMGAVVFAGAPARHPFHVGTGPGLAHARLVVCRLPDAASFHPRLFFTAASIGARSAGRIVRALS